MKMYPQLWSYFIEGREQKMYYNLQLYHIEGGRAQAPFLNPLNIKNVMVLTFTLHVVLRLSL